ncbi:hypothetical protein OsI_20549 [Oryza sativa Indica Group]|uniref:DUF6598 domain-containing protein n=1 Tax=Oryza sativa subsp. indica TaxID=39946 RepID=A2Y6B4_ORYSI|nr:hypothetical protein OsI_20549 [Oryza sativa Indica Group]
MAVAAEEACHGGGAGFDLAEHLQQQPLLTSDDRPKAPTMIDDDDDASLGNKLYTNLEDRDYPITMIQIFSMRFAGDGVQLDQSMRVYGFVAIHDELDCRRNYVFNRSRDVPCDITPPLIVT